MAITYTRTEWQNDEAGGTPISAENLNNIEDGISSAVDALNNIEELLSPLSIDMGGTGATSKEEALANIGAAATQHKHAATDINSGTLAVARGGTGGATAEAARAALAVASTSELAEVSKAVDEAKDQIQAVQDSVSTSATSRNITDIFTAASGWSIQEGSYCSWGSLLYFFIRVQPTSAISTSNVTIGTFKKGSLDTQAGVLNCFAGSQSYNQPYITANQLRWNTGALAANVNVYIKGMYILA